MQVNIELGSYSTATGLRLNWVPGYELRVAVTGVEVLISGNEQGLRSLAHHLLTLADQGVPAGVHAHMEPGMELEDDSSPLVVAKVSSGS